MNDDLRKHYRTTLLPKIVDRCYYKRPDRFTKPPWVTDAIYNKFYFRTPNFGVVKFELRMFCFERYDITIVL